MEDETVELAFEVHESEYTNKDLNPIIMIHGALFNKRTMTHIARGLSEETQRQVYSIDLRNHGGSPETNNLSYIMMIADLKRFITERGLRKFSFVCHSFSSTVAYVIALDMPDSVEKMVFVDNPPFNDNNEEFNKINAYPMGNLHERLLKTLDPRMTLKDARKKLMGFYEASRTGERFFFKKIAEELTKVDRKFQYSHDYGYFMDQYRKGFLSLEPRGSSDKEILIIRCSNSTQVWDAKFEAVKKHNPRAQLLTFENASHFLLLEQPEKFIQVTADFLRMAS